MTAVFPDVPGACWCRSARCSTSRAAAYVLVVDAQTTRSSAAASRSAIVHDGMQQIVEGLAAGERVIVDGVQKARPGAKVMPKPLEPTPASP